MIFGEKSSSATRDTAQTTERMKAKNDGKAVSPNFRVFEALCL